MHCPVCKQPVFWVLGKVGGIASYQPCGCPGKLERR